MGNKIVLIGFMGSGKTTIGKELGEKLEIAWVDLDEAIEQRSEASISHLFETLGEVGFRKLETECLQECLCTKENLVLSTGGGVIEREENCILLNTYTTFYLKWKFNTLYGRIKGDKNRPLVKSYEQLKALYIKREALYKKSSSYVILCEKKPIPCIIEEILKKVGIES